MTVASDFVKQWEGFSATPYLDAAGLWTNGYGNRQGVNANTPRVSEIKAAAVLEVVLNEIALHVHKVAKYFVNPNQTAALCSLIYNIGPVNFDNSTLLRYINGNHFAMAADEFPRWNKIHKNGIVIALPGLTARRAAERELFLKP